MGEAKRKRSASTQSFLKTLDDWSFPDSQWERETVNEILGLPVYTAVRYPAEVLAYMKMPVKECHANAQFMEQNDPDGEIRRVSGWWPQDGNFVLHSVILRKGQHFCVTPQQIACPDSFDFIPDSKIEWRDEGDIRQAYRSGVAIRYGVRLDPRKTLEEIEIVRARLRSGMSVYQATKKEI
ncbi:hypothetical protein [Cereibacter changlensis]|uniref:hypothetical protein n=1 Tax=Cereibacter changlensis TaxID=402884 RepID=UPI0011B1FDF2|nr:hypothetical protein [Cereibacter changlensis]